MLHASATLIFNGSDSLLYDLKLPLIVLHAPLIRPGLTRLQCVPCFLVFPRQIVDLLLVQRLLRELLLVIVLQAVQHVAAGLVILHGFPLVV